MADAVRYLRIIALGAPFIMFNNVFANVIRADGAAKESMIANCAGTFVNIALDALFILVFSWDVAGAAVATVLGNCVSCIYLLYYMTKKQPVLSLSPRQLSLQPEISWTVISLGLPMACSTLLMSLSAIIANRMVISYGSVALAAQQRNLWYEKPLQSLIYRLCNGSYTIESYCDFSKF